MVDVVGGVKSYLFKRDEATIDNITFKLHYRVSFAVLLSCMALVGIIHTLDIITFKLHYRVSFAVLLSCMALVGITHTLDNITFKLHYRCPSPSCSAAWHW